MNTKQVESHFTSQVGLWTKRKEDLAHTYVYGAYAAKLYPRAKGRIALDLGSGAGIYTEGLRSSFSGHIVALDLSKEMLMNLFEKGVLRIQGNGCALPFKDRSFDFVISMGLIECLDDKKAALKEIKRVLAKGGVARVRFVNRGGIWGKVERVKRLLGIPTGYFSYNHNTRTEIIQMIEESGLKLRKLEGMVALPVFLLPNFLGRAAGFVAVKLGIATFLENRDCGDNYYSYLAEVTR